MNNFTTQAGAPAFDGTAALSARACQPRLVLIEGGRRAQDARLSERPRTPRPQGLTRAQSALLVACGVALVAALALASLVSDALRGQSLSAALGSRPAETVVVQDGDSLWGIAEAHAVEGVGTAELVSWIEEENGLAGGLLTPGQRLVVPAPSLG